MKPAPFWTDMTGDEIAQADTSAWIAVLPVGATEQHGPHLPASTDCDIGRAMVAKVIELLPESLPVTFLPMQEVGASAEHGDTPGTMSKDPCVLAEEWFAIAADLKAKGINRMVLVSSHGGNTQACDMTILRVRIELGMLAVATSWSRFGYAEGLFSADEIAIGIHGGDVETSIMLAACPDKVQMDKAEDFSSTQKVLSDEMRHLRAYGPHRMGWMMHDLNPKGVVGNAANATVDKGHAVIAHQAAGFVELLEDVQRFDLNLFKR